MFIACFECPQPVNTEASATCKSGDLEWHRRGSDGEVEPNPAGAEAGEAPCAIGVYIGIMENQMETTGII